MCGIAGLFTGNHVSLVVLKKQANAMLEPILHRGSDDAREWCDANIGFAFADRRLSILDLSMAGQQSMLSGAGSYLIIFNGEI